MTEDHKDQRANKSDTGENEAYLRGLQLDQLVHLIFDHGGFQGGFNSLVNLLFIACPFFDSNANRKGDMEDDLEEDDPYDSDTDKDEHCPGPELQISFSNCARRIATECIDAVGGKNQGSPNHTCYCLLALIRHSQHSLLQCVLSGKRIVKYVSLRVKSPCHEWQHHI